MAAISGIRAAITPCAPCAPYAGVCAKTTNKRTIRTLCEHNPCAGTSRTAIAAVADQTTIAAQATIATRAG